MRTVTGFGGATAALLVLVWSGPSLAQSCSDLVFTGEIAQKYPNAKNACLDVVQRDGRSFAHFKARIVSTSRAGMIQAEFKQPDGTYTRPIEFTPPSNQRLRIAGQSLRAAASSPSTVAWAMSSSAEPGLRSQIVTAFTRSSARARRNAASSVSPAVASPAAMRAIARA